MRNRVWPPSCPGKGQRFIHDVKAFHPLIYSASVHRCGGLCPVPATLLLYASNVFLVSVAVCLVEARPLRELGKCCYFWTFPYYLAGAAFAGLMMAASRSLEWYEALLVLPLALLLYLSYRLHVNRAAVTDQQQAPV